MIASILISLAWIGPSPVGLVLFAALLLGAFLYWNVALRHVRPPIGPGPLAFGFAMFVGGWFVSALVVTGGQLDPSFDGQLALLVFLLGLLPAFLVLAVVGVPVAVFLVRTERLGYAMGGAILLLFVALASLLVTLESGSNWLGPYPARSYPELLGQVAMYVVPPGGAAIVGLVYAVRRQRRRGSVPPSDGALRTVGTGDRRNWRDSTLQLTFAGIAIVVLAGAVAIFGPLISRASGQPIESAPLPQSLLTFHIAPEEAAAVRAFVADLARAEGFEARDYSRTEVAADRPLVSIEIANGTTTALVVAGGRGLGEQPIEVDRLTPAAQFDAFTIRLIAGLRERWPPDPRAAP